MNTNKKRNKNKTKSLLKKKTNARIKKLKKRRKQNIVNPKQINQIDRGNFDL